MREWRQWRLTRQQEDRLLVAAMWFNMTRDLRLLTERIAAIVPGAKPGDFFYGGPPNYRTFYGAGPGELSAGAADRAAYARGARGKR